MKGGASLCSRVRKPHRHKMSFRQSPIVWIGNTLIEFFYNKEKRETLVQKSFSGFSGE